MCSPFFHEFQVIPSANGFRLVCYTATLFPTEDPDYRGLTRSGIVLTLAGGEEQGSMIYLVMEACKNSSKYMN
jgi:hypothetical protein